MTEFGLALVIGGLAFSASMIPVIAYLINFGCRKKRPSPIITAEYLFSINRFKNCFIRDMIISLASLFFYFLSLQSGTISILDVSIQLVLFVIYCIAVYL